MVRLAGREAGRGPVKLLPKAVKLRRPGDVVELKLAGRDPEKLELLMSMD